MGHPDVSHQAVLRISAALSLAALLAGCGLFDTRDPEPPEGNIPAVPRISPTHVVHNVHLAYEVGSAGIAVYDQQIAGDFDFEMDPTDVTEFGSNPFVDWNKDKEKSNISRVFERHGTLRLTLNLHADGVDSLEVDTPVDPTADGEVYFKAAPYIIVAEADTTFSGTADVYFRDKAGTWTMFRWADIRGTAGGFKTFGLMKASVQAS